MQPSTKLLIYFIGLGLYVVLNLIAFFLMLVDKRKARSQSRRIPEKALFLWAGLFGGIGGTLGMFLFRHKTQHWNFRLFFPLMAVVQLALVIWGNAALLVA